MDTHGLEMPSVVVQHPPPPYSGPQATGVQVPMIVQPMPAAPVVHVNLGPTIAPSIFPDLRPWTSGLCSCCDDCASCCCGFWCPLCHACQIAQRMEERCWCCLGCSYPVALYGMRAKVRTKYGIQGTLYEDLKCAMCCPGCIACQMDRELTSMGVP